MKTDIFIFGMGNMGKRHIQSLSSLDCFEKIYAFDINKNALNSVEGFCNENNIDKSSLILSDCYDEIESKISKNCIVIMSTTANGRDKILAPMLIKRPRAVVVDKPLCQNESEYQRILNLSSKHEVPIYVNFHRHMYPFYREIFSHIEKLKPRSFFAKTWGGMACNGIHVFELITWLFNVERFEIIHSSCSAIYETKRNGFYDFEGEIVFIVNDNIICNVSAKNKKNLETYEISAGSVQYHINESAHKMTIINSSDSQEVKEIDVLYMSQITGSIITDILKGQQHVKIPNIQQCYLAHKILFDLMDFHEKKGVNIT